jgi:hypothetical protein
MPRRQAAAPAAFLRSLGLERARVPDAVDQDLDELSGERR